MKTTQPGDRANHNRIQAAFSGWTLTWGGLRNNTQGEWWLFSQVVLILAVILLPAWPVFTTDGAHGEPVMLGWLLPIGWLLAIGWLLVAGGAVLAGQALITLGANLSPLPDPKPGANLVNTGPYRLCRHPLYLAVLICAIGVMVLRLSALHGVLVVALALVLRGKARREEHRLLLVHPSYNQVFANTPGIAPWIPGLNWRVKT